MKASKTFDKIVMDNADSPSDYPRGYAVYASNSTPPLASDWGTPIAQQTNPANGNFPSTTIQLSQAITARHIKIAQTGTSNTNWWSIHELQVYGTESPGIQWAQTSIGSPQGGNASQTNSIWTINGSGTDIYNSPDSFYYVHQDSDEDCSIVAKVESLTNTSSGWARAGIMIRESTGVDARYAMVCFTPGNGVRFQCRTASGGGSSLGQLHPSATSGYVRIIRSGNVFTANYSADGISWPTAYLQSVTFPSGMSNTTKSGLIVCNHSTSTTPAQGVFSHVNVTP
jgi:hypothetical protein